MVLAAIVAALVLDLPADIKKTCETRAGSLDCVFEVGADLSIAIAGIGTEMASVTFTKSDRAGAAFAKYQTAIQCVLVLRGERAPQNQPAAGQEMAFISPRSGKIFRSAAECRGN